MGQIMLHYFNLNNCFHFITLIKVEKKISISNIINTLPHISYYLIIQHTTINKIEIYLSKLSI